jgi:PadR family transcriptional regulator, regulatory protein AphA
MSIKYAILGFLSWKAFTGYELKKLFAESDTLAWSGNSNQIYKTLVELHKEELVSLEIQPQEAHPDRKVYSITEKGQAELKSWLQATPEPPVQKNSLLLQLTWADSLETEEIESLLQAYQEKLHTQALMFRLRDQRKAAPRRTPREILLWDMISDNWISFYENEIRWVSKVREELDKLRTEQE